MTPSGNDVLENTMKAQMAQSGLLLSSLPQNNIPIPGGRRPNRLRAWRWDQKWNNLLVCLGLRTDWMDPDNAPPAFTAVPHKYVEMPDLKCCPKCGGGKNHSIHIREV